jgi:putative DNA primase/helicase
MAAAIAEGQRWFDCRVEAAPVVYAALEGEAGFKLRAQAWETQPGPGLPDGLRMMLQPFKLTDGQDVLDLAAVVPAGAVVVLDTLNRAAPTADENSSRDMGEILEAAKTLQTLTGGLVLLVHHTGKNAAAGLRGHSSLFAAMDAAIEVSRDGDRREWKVAKSKDGRPPDRPGQDGTTTGHVPDCPGTQRDNTLKGCPVVPAVPVGEDEDEGPPQLSADADTAERMQ